MLLQLLHTKKKRSAHYSKLSAVCLQWKCFCSTQIVPRTHSSSLKSFDLINLLSVKCEKITFRREATSVGKIPRFSGVSREQNVNKSWVNKQLTGMLAFWRLHMESSVVNKQLMKYPIFHPRKSSKKCK